jgi:hypothetical protein
MDNAPGGYLTGIDPEDIADGAEWEGDPLAFIDALCYAGFLDDAEEVHDWYDYAGKLIEKRAKDAERKRESRRKEDDPAPSEARNVPVQRTSAGRPRDGAGTVPNRTVPNLTEPEKASNTAEVGGVGGASHGADAPPAAHSRPPRPLKHPLPEDFPLTDERRDWLAEHRPDLNPDQAHEEFCTYWRSIRLEEKGRKTDWEMTWRNGMLRSRMVRAPSRASPNGHRLSVSEHNDRVLREVFGDEPDDVSEVIEATFRSH